MVRIRITAACTTAKLDLKPGDEIHVADLTPELQTLLNARRVDGEPVAQLVRGNSTERATARQQAQERATA
ncbi:MAG TPA: hypothetical protein VF422_07545 [Dokdonella sp.]